MIEERTKGTYLLSLSRYELSQDSLLTDQRLQISVPHLPKQGPSSCH